MLVEHHHLWQIMQVINAWDNMRLSSALCEKKCCAVQLNVMYMYPRMQLLTSSCMRKSVCMFISTSVDVYCIFTSGYIAHNRRLNVCKSRMWCDPRLVTYVDNNKHNNPPLQKSQFAKISTVGFRHIHVHVHVCSNIMYPIINERLAVLTCTWIAQE